MKKTLIIIGIVATTVGCGVLQKKLLRNEKATMDVSYMDKSTLPQDDFFQFANGTWVKNNPVPPSESRWGRTITSGLLCVIYRHAEPK